MSLPNADALDIPKAKITDYLLSESHRDGRHKAAFFIAHGFTAGAWRQLAEALRRHALTHEVAKIEDSPFGTRYIVEGMMETPDGRSPHVRTVWFVEADSPPRLVTAYPLKRITP